MSFCITSGSAARHPSLYLALRARPWLRMSRSYDLSDVDTTLLLFAAAGPSLGSELAERCFVDFSRGLLQLLLSSVMGLLQLRYEHDSSTIQHPTRSYVLSSNNEHVNSFAML